MATHVTGRDVRVIWESGLSKNTEFTVLVWGIYEGKRSSLQQDVRALLEDGARSFWRASFERIMMFQQEVTILSHDTPSKMAISPLLSLNGCAVPVEKVFRGMKIEMVSQLNSLASPCGQMLCKVPVWSYKALNISNQQVVAVKHSFTAEWLDNFAHMEKF